MAGGFRLVLARPGGGPIDQLLCQGGILTGWGIWKAPISRSSNAWPYSPDLFSSQEWRFVHQYAVHRDDEFLANSKSSTSAVDRALEETRGLVSEDEDWWPPAGWRKVDAIARRP
jgi:hypothetical protein